MFDRMLNICRVHRLGAILVFVIFVSACSGPGAPALRTSASDGQGELMPNCQNVSKRTRVDHYITKFYLSTYGSALVEGAMQEFLRGLAKGADSATGVRAWIFGMMAPDENQPNALPFTLQPYCMKYDASVLAVSRAVASILPRLGNQILNSDEANGFFKTAFIDRFHRAARWRDRYVISVTRETDQTVVRVFRILYISRRDGPFNEAISVGHNEAWILLRIADYLK